jgi:hypothetical protein
MDKVSPEGSMQLLPKMSNKLWPSIEHDDLWNSMQTQHTSDMDLDILLSIVVGVDGYEVDEFGESIHDHPNWIKLVGSKW